MPFIGNQPAESYSAFQKQDFSTSATTSYTLDNPVANANELALFINFVRQEPTTAYSASGTSLTLTSATASSDDMYCVYLGKAVQTVNPPNASVGNSQTAPTIITGQTAETSIATDDTILIHDTSASALRKMTRANFVSGIGGTNTPAFMATQGSTQSSLSSDATTKVAMNTEVFDTDGAYDHSTNYRFTVPSGKAGKYLFFGQAKIRSDSVNYLRQAAVYLYKNGNNITNSVFYESDYVLETTLNFSYADNASVGDYYELYAKGTTGSSTYNIGSGLFGATFLIT